MIVLKNIDMTLDRASIAHAIAAITDFRNQLSSAMTHLIETLTEKGAEIAKAELIMFTSGGSDVSSGTNANPAYSSGALSDSIQGAMLNDKDGVITTGVVYAIFVEYGTGIKGAGSPHPLKGELGIEYPAAMKYGVDGWVYRGDDGQFHRTAGMPSRPFMYNTLRDLQAEAEAIGGKVIAEYIP